MRSSRVKIGQERCCLSQATLAQVFQYFIKYFEHPTPSVELVATDFFCIDSYITARVRWEVSNIEDAKPRPNDCWGTFAAKEEKLDGFEDVILGMIANNIEGDWGRLQRTEKPEFTFRRTNEDHFCFEIGEVRGALPHGVDWFDFLRSNSEWDRWLMAFLEPQVLKSMGVPESLQTAKDRFAARMVKLAGMDTQELLRLKEASRNLAESPSPLGRLVDDGIWKLLFEDRAFAPRPDRLPDEGFARKLILQAVLRHVQHQVDYAARLRRASILADGETVEARAMVVVNRLLTGVAYDFSNFCKYLAPPKVTSDTLESHSAANEADPWPSDPQESMSTGDFDDFVLKHLAPAQQRFIGESREKILLIPSPKPNPEDLCAYESFQERLVSVCGNKYGDYDALPAAPPAGGEEVSDEARRRADVEEYRLQRRTWLAPDNGKWPRSRGPASLLVFGECTDRVNICSRDPDWVKAARPLVIQNLMIAHAAQRSDDACLT